MNCYPDISDRGLIGDLQTAALVTTDGTIDFFCCPRFDSPSVFCSLLDAEKGGYFRISPDPLWLSTLDGMDKELVSDSLVYRYNPAASPDGLHGEEGTFSLCAFLCVDALARAGRLDDAVLTFEKMFTYGNHLGLYSEEIGSTGEQLGNFPQAFTHLSLINAAITLNRELDKRASLYQPVPELAAH